MFNLEEKVVYFNKEGKENTDDVINLVKSRLDKSDNINYIVIASASGNSALRLANKINGNAEIINITHHAGFHNPNELDISEEMLDKLNENGVYTFIGSHALSGVGRGITNKFGGVNPTEIIAETLRMFSHGIKVCGEIAIMAADAGLIPTNEDIIAIGGRGSGLDSAAVIKPANMTNVFDLRFHEIICMPRP